jgi:hypothetical protein
MIEDRDELYKCVVEAQELLRADKLPEARESLLETLERWPKRGVTLYFLSLVCLELADRNDDDTALAEEAIIFARRHVENAPNLVKASANLFHILWSLNRGIDAINELARYLSFHDSEKHLLLAAQMRNHLKSTGEDPKFLAHLDQKLPEIQKLPGVL